MSNWNERDIEILKLNYNESKELLEEIFPNRKWKSIQYKINQIGLSRERFVKHFTESEINILKQNYMLPKNELIKMFQNRSWDVLRKKMDEMGLDRNKSWRFWSREEEKIIEQCNTIEEMVVCLPNRTITQIYTKAKTMNKFFDDNWNEDELKILIKYYGKTFVKNFIHLLPNRTHKAIYIKAYQMKLKGVMGRFDIEDAEIVSMYTDDKLKCEEIANLLNVSIQTIYNRLQRNDIKFEPYIPRGENHPNWKGGITPENQTIRQSIEYKNWRLSVFERDNYTCQCCGDNSGGNLRAHHIENFSENEDLRLDVDNGMTLCANCHDPQFEGSFHYIYKTKNNNLDQIKEYIANKTI